MTPEQKNGKLVGMIGRQIADGGTSLEKIPHSIEKLIDDCSWKRFQIFTGEVVEHKRFSDLVTSDPPRGWGFDPSKVEALLNDEPRVLVKWREAMKQQPGPKVPDSSGNNVTPTKAIKGNSKAYTLSRLERDHSELFEAVCNGELSANKAAIEAGFRKPPTPSHIIRREWKKLTKRERTAFTKWTEDNEQ